MAAQAMEQYPASAVLRTAFVSVKGATCDTIQHFAGGSAQTTNATMGLGSTKKPETPQITKHPNMP